MKPYPMREEHKPVRMPTWGLLPVSATTGVVGGLAPVSAAASVLIAVGLFLVVSLVWALAIVVTNRRRAAGHAYRQATDPIVDESLGTWVHHSMRDRDNARGGFWEGK